MIIAEKHLPRRRSLLLSAIFMLSLLLCLPVPQNALGSEGAPMKGTLLWPAGVDGWRISEGPMDYDGTSAYRYMNGAAELFLAYNMKKLTVLRYEKQDRPAITLEVFHMASPADAYGIFTFESDDPGAGIGQGSEFGGGLLRFWKGYYFVSIYGESPGNDVETATLSLGRHVASAIRDRGKPPDILSYLPPGAGVFERIQTWFFHSHILLNQRFFVSHKNILNLAPDVDVGLARYQGGKERVHLLVVKYPDRRQAQKALSSFRDAYLPDAKGRPAAKTENNRWTAAEEYRGFIVIVFDAPDEPFARKLMDAVSRASGKEGI